MTKVELYNQDGVAVGELELKDSVFGIEPNKNVLTEAILMQRASMRQGTHKVKGRSEVRGGGRKPWRQKGTGRARQGTIRAPQWRGGGIVFGPTPRSYAYKLPKKVRRLAIISALSAKVQEGNLIILDQFLMPEKKTKEFYNVLKNLQVDKTKTLVVTSKFDENIVFSSRNIQGVTTISSSGVNVLDVVSHTKMILTKEAVESIEGVLG